jgi:molybdenum cofactor synthesis domain-containing protein
MRPFTDTLPFADALARILDAVEPMTRAESLGLDKLDGRVLAEDVNAPIDVPAFDRAAMDGYAVRAEDTVTASASAPVSLTYVGQLFTGSAARPAVGPGECVEIATGAPVPAGATAVVMVERTVRAARAVTVAAPLKPGENIGRRGADITRGEIVARAGDLLTPARVGALAAIGRASARVFTRPRVVVMSSGDEVDAPGSPLAAGHVYDVNSFTLAAVARQHGAVAVRRPALPDRIEALVAALDASQQDRPADADADEWVGAADILVVAGGSSVGNHDLTVDAVRQRGEIIFHGIAVKPGKPTLFARVGRTLVFGMPGYPSSCLSNAYMLLVPALRKMARLPPWRPETVRVPLARRVTSVAGRHQFYTVRIVNGEAEPAFKSSGDITSMARAEGFFEIPSDVEAVEAGTVVDVRLF